MNFSAFIGSRLSLSKQNTFLKIIVNISIVTIAMSIMVMILASSIIKGFKSEVSDKVFGFWGHINIVSPSLNSLFDTAPIAKKQSFLQPLDTLGQVEVIDYNGSRLIAKGGIEGTYSYVMVPGIIAFEENIEGVLLKGIGENMQYERLNRFMIQGEPIDYSDSVGSKDIVLSNYIANRLQIEIGDRLDVYFQKNGQETVRRLSVSGIYKTGLEEYDKKLVLIDVRTGQSMLGWNDSQVSGFEVFVKNVNDMEIYDRYIYEELLPPDLYSESIKQKFPNIFDWLELQNINEYLILILLLIVSVINLVTVLFIMIIERTRMVGIFKSMGSTNWAIRKIFVYQAIRIIWRGMLIGNALGLGLCWLQYKWQFIQLNEADYYVAYAPISFNFPLIIVINLVFFIVTILSLTIPTYFVSLLSPVRSIRFN